jgi:hypothetical protein
VASERTPARLVWAAAVLVGTALRAWRLPTQIPVDDEWHALHRVVDSSYPEIALSFGFVDHCIPLTLFYKLVADTIGLGDVAFRAPSLLAGIALLIVAPWLLRDRLTPWTQAGFAWLLALSPLLIFYSRFARPYALAALLSFLAVERAARIARRPTARDARLYGLAAALAIYVLPPSAPFVLAPVLVWGVAPPIRSARDAVARLRPLAWALALATVLVLPPLLTHPEFVLGKLGVGGYPTLSALGRASAFWLAPWPWLAAIAVAGIAAGAWALAQTAPRLAACAGASVLALALGIFAAAPAYAWLGFVLGRYALPALPFACLALALAPQLVAKRLPGALHAAACVGFGSLVLAASGIPRALAEAPAWFPNRWVAGTEGTPPEPREVPAFYRSLAEQAPDSLTLVEAPWIYGLWNNALPAYAALHRQRVRIGFTEGACSALSWGQYPQDSGIALRAFVSLADDAALEAQSVDYIVLHRDPLGELVRVIDPIDAKATEIPRIEGCAQALIAKGWQPAHGDDSVLALAPPER